MSVWFTISGQSKSWVPIKKGVWGMPEIQKGWVLRGQGIWWEGRLHEWSGIRSQRIWQGWEKTARNHQAALQTEPAGMAWLPKLWVSPEWSHDCCGHLHVSQEALRALVHIFCDSNKGWVGGLELRIQGSSLQACFQGNNSETMWRLPVRFWRGNEAKSLEDNRKPVQAS